VRVLPFVNQKGGCGKTTSAVNLAGALAKGGARVLLADLDPQAHASLAMGIAVSGPTALDVMRGDASIGEAAVAGPAGVRVVPATEALAQFEEEAARRLAPERALRRALEGARGDFDYCILDCPARVDGVLPANALAAATTAILVVETGAFALQGALKALKVIDEVRRDHGVRFETRVLATLYDRRTRFARELLVALHARFGGALFHTAIHTSVRLREAAGCGQPIQELAPRSRAAGDFAALAEEIGRLVAGPGVGSSPLAGPAGDEPVPGPQREVPSA